MEAYKAKRAKRSIKKVVKKAECECISDVLYATVPTLESYLWDEVRPSIQRMRIAIWVLVSFDIVVGYALLYLL